MPTVTVTVVFSYYSSSQEHLSPAAFNTKEHVNFPFLLFDGKKNHKAFL